MEKRFRQAVGASPKKFASIVRFKYILQQHKAKDKLMDLAHEAGFYDQAHFIKEFKGFTGKSPEAFFDKEYQKRFFTINGNDDVRALLEI